MTPSTLISARPGASSTGSRLPRHDALVRVICATPELVASGLAGFAIVPMLMLLIGHFVLAVAIPLGVLGAVVAMALCRTSPESVTPRTALATIAAAVIVLTWCIVNSFYSAVDLYAHRDPTTYNLTGRWLMDHDSLPIATHPELFGSPTGYIDSSAGFSNSSIGHVYAQGNHLLPVLLAVAGKLFGVGALLRVNVLFGALALFVFFGIARRIVGPVWALVVMTAFAVSIPMIYVSRDTFSEPLALLYLMGGLLLLHRAITCGRVRDFALAGFVAGTAAMARIDTDASLLALIIVLTVLLARAPIGQRQAAGVRTFAAVAGAIVPAAIGWADVAWLASGYYHDERTHILLLVKAAVVLAVVGAVVVLLVWRPPIRAVFASTRLRAHGATVASVGIVLAFAGLASRPFWMTGHGPLTLYLIDVQKQAGDAPDGTRTYNEQTINWQALYFGWPTVVLGVIGYVLLVRRLLRQRDYALLGVLVMGLAMSALYLWSSQITPDQPWATRRFVPVVMPVLLTAAAFAARALVAQLSRVGRALGVVGAVAGAAVMLVIPLHVTWPAFGIREEVPQLAQVKAICAQVGPSGAVVDLDYNSQWSYAQTIRSYCNVPTLGLLGATPAQLAQVRASLLQHGKTLYVLAEDPSKIKTVTGKPTVFSRAATTRWPSTLHVTPTKPAVEIVTVYLGLVQPDGLAQTLRRP